MLAEQAGWGVVAGPGAGTNMDLGNTLDGRGGRLRVWVWVWVCGFDEEGMLPPPLLLLAALPATTCWGWGWG